MERRELMDMQKKYMDIMIKNMPVLRAAMNITQEELAKKVGVSRQTIVSIETRKRPMSWSLYLAMICVFEHHEDSKKLLESLELFDEQFIKEIK